MNDITDEEYFDRIGLRFKHPEDARQAREMLEKSMERITSPYDEQPGGDHYRSMKIQPMQFCMENGLDFATSNAIKYIVRKKGDREKRAEDLRKAKHCIDILAQHEGIEL